MIIKDQKSKKYDNFKIGVIYSLPRAKEVFPNTSPAATTGVQRNENGDQEKAASSAQTKKSYSEIVREKEEKLRFCSLRDRYGQNFGRLSPMHVEFYCEVC